MRYLFTLMKSLPGTEEPAPIELKAEVPIKLAIVPLLVSIGASFSASEAIPPAAKPPAPATVPAAKPPAPTNDARPTSAIVGAFIPATFPLNSLFLETPMASFSILLRDLFTALYLNLLFILNGLLQIFVYKTRNTVCFFILFLYGFYNIISSRSIIFYLSSQTSSFFIS